MEDVLAAMETCGPSVSEDDLEQFRMFSGKPSAPHGHVFSVHT